MRTIPGSPLLGFRSMPCHGADDPDSDVGPCGDGRQRLTTALHTCDRRAGLGPMAGHPLGRFCVDADSGFGQMTALLLSCGIPTVNTFGT